MITGLSVVIVAAVLQGVFLLPMARTRGWAWEHTWAAFSLMGMFLGNWILTLLSLSNPAAIYASVPGQELAILAAFGVCWGIGAVLFGLAMDTIGLTLGYPVIMGLNASVGTFVPLLWLYGASMFAGRRLLIAAGTAVGVLGIVACSVAGARKEGNQPAAEIPSGSSPSRFLPGVIMAVVSGFLSCLPNIGLTYGTNTLRVAREMGASAGLAGNAVWFIFFTCGGIVNVLYCFWLMIRHKNVSTLFRPAHIANWWWMLAMGAMWIGSFCLYATGVAHLGASGSTIAWPIFVSLSIAIGVLAGLGKGEWSHAPGRAKKLLWGGLALLILAVFIIPLGTVSQ